MQTDFRQIDANRFEARAFVSRKERALCGIWLGSTFGADGLYCSFNGARDGSYNESVSASDHGSALTMEDAVEYFWNLFVERLRWSARSRDSGDFLRQRPRMTLPHARGVQPSSETAIDRAAGA